MHFSELPSLLGDMARLQALAETELLDSASEERFDRYTRLAARLLHAPTSLISLVDDRRQFFKSFFGLGEPWATLRETPLSHSFCKHAVASGEALIVKDATKHPLLHENLAIPDLGVIAYAGIPLKAAGKNIGVLCVVDAQPRSWTEDDIDTLRSLAAAVSSEIELSLARRKLSEKEGLLSALTTSALDSIIITSATGQIVFCNRAAETMFLRTREQLLGSDIAELMPERYRAAHQAGVARLNQGLEPRVIGRVVELHGRRGNGEEFPLELSLSRLVSDGGSLITGVIRDITERSRTTQALRDAEEELRLTVDHAPIGIALVSPVGRWLRVNDAMAEMVGYSREELLEIDFQRLTHPEDLAADLMQVNQLLRGEISSYDMKKRYFHRDGSIVWVHLAVSLVRSVEGLPRFFVAQIQDITARVIAEQSALKTDAIIHAVIESMSDAVIVADQDGRIVLLNEVAKGLFGKFLEDGNQEGFRPGEGLFLADQVTRCPSVDRPLARALRGESVDQFEMWMRLPDWSEGRWHSVTGNPVRDREGQLLGAVIVGRDITSRKSMEEQVRRAALTDELTGLYNRRGFTLMAEQQLRLAHRHKQPIHLFFIDLDGMKRINDELGHDAGDDALIETATVLTRACRSSDIVARLGGDEFVILAEGDPSAMTTLRARLEGAVADRNAQREAGFELALSIGTAAYEAKKPALLSQMLSDADQAMYEDKRRRKSLPGT